MFILNKNSKDFYETKNKHSKEIKYRETCLNLDIELNCIFVNLQQVLNLPMVRLFFEDPLLSEKQSKKILMGFI